jgi:hypothetical protein
MSKYLARAALVAALGIGFSTAQGNAQANCDWYAKTSLKQQQENEQRKCGFTGPGWSSDLKAHMTWCAANPDLWKNEAQKREQQLSTCKK